MGDPADRYSISILSKQTVRPPPRRSNNNDGEASAERFHLNPWDLRMISVDYIQKGILFHKPHRQSTEAIISDLITSFSLALARFYPLAGRLVTTTEHDGGGSLSISLDCTDEGAEFTHASAPHLKVSDILTPSQYYIPTVVRSFFPLNGLIGIDGHSSPLLAAQITELDDGIFVACSLNHSAADGTSFWCFFNAWSHICRTAGSSSADVDRTTPALDRWFPEFCPPPVRLPFRSHEQFIKRVNLPPLPECAFHFPSESIKKLKARANEETGGGSRISSLQALLAHAWRSVTRARGLEPEQETTYVVLVGYRSRLSPPLPDAYLGNAVIGAPVMATAREIIDKGLGWTAWLINRAVAAQGEIRVGEWVASWVESPSFMYTDQFKDTDVGTGSSPRFNVYGNDFGWGRPVAVRSGPGNKMNGKMTVYPGPEEGSMALEICLAAVALRALLEDGEFLEVVG